MTQFKGVECLKKDDLEKLFNDGHVELGDGVSLDYDEGTAYATEEDDSEKVKVVYDMSSADANINWGYTSGICSGIWIDGKDLSKYKRLKIIWKIYANHGITAEIDLKNYKTQMLGSYGYVKLIDTSEFVWEFYYNLNIQTNGQLRVIIKNQNFEEEGSGCCITNIIGEC